jgi:glycosyltransferase involved in cell wall biosynthesis
MKIALDARWIFTEISGIGAHTRDLIRHMAREDHTNTYVLIFSDRTLAERTWREAELGDKSNFRPDIVPWSIFSPRSQLMLPSRLARQGIDVYHSTNYMIPLAAFPKGRMGRVKCVTTIHDLIPLLFPSATPRAMKTRLFPVYRRLMLEIGARADRIIAVSNASRQDILSNLNIPAERHNAVRVIYNGVSSAFCPPESPAGKTDDPARPRTLLYVGRSDPYKNLIVLIESLALARQSVPFPLRLKIIGPPDPRYPEAGLRVEALGLKDSVSWVGYQSSEALVRAYQEADAVVLPSRYEGFGFPVVEGMACGTPVICSDIPVLREIGGEAAYYATLDNAPALADSIRCVLTTPELRGRMIQLGYEQARQFTWTEAARQTIALYRELAETKPGESA